MFDPDENLGFATKVHRDKKMGDEAGIRAAVSRCYYSSLLTVKPYLGPDKPDDDDLHDIAIDFVQNMDRELADRLITLYNYRIIADMADGVSWDRDVIASVHGMARVFNQSIKRILAARGARSAPGP